MAEKLVRIREYNPRIGHVVQTYTYTGIKFQSTKGWYSVSEYLANELRGVTQIADDPSSKPVFDIMDAADAQLAEKREKAAKAKASARTPIKVTEARTIPGVIHSATVAPVQAKEVIIDVDDEDAWPDDMADEATVAEPSSVVEAVQQPVIEEPVAPARLGPPAKGRRFK